MVRMGEPEGSARESADEGSGDRSDRGTRREGLLLGRSSVRDVCGQGPATRGVAGKRNLLLQLAFRIWALGLASVTRPYVHPPGVVIYKLLVAIPREDSTYLQLQQVGPSFAGSTTGKAQPPRFGSLTRSRRVLRTARWQADDMLIIAPDLQDIRVFHAACCGFTEPGVSLVR